MPNIRGASTVTGLNCRHGVLAALPLLVLIGFFFLDPIAQPLSYHDFADNRALWGIPNFGDVVTNLAFLVSGLLGIHVCLKYRPSGALPSWSVFFIGVILVSAGSAYYHWSPVNATLVWDRLPMTIGFMGVYAALLTEFVDRRLQRFVLLPAALLGLASVVYWAMADDLRLYFAVQAMSLGSLVLILALFKNPFRQNRYLVAAFACYALAILCEQLDREIFGLTGGTVSGHTIKHLLAAAAPFWVFSMLRARIRTPPTPPSA